MLLLDINRKAYIGSPLESNSVITFDLSDLEGAMSRSLRFGRLISHIGAKIDHMLLLKSNRKPYM